MNKPSTQALLTLLPTLSTFPPELVDLAASLLAQSLNKASSMKQEEEIARPYACAHLACDRLKTTLDLPTITARPPCPPRIYKKLYTFLDSALAPHTSRKRQADNVGKPELTPRKKTETRARRGRPIALLETPSKRGRAAGCKIRESGDDLSYLLPLIRGVCAELGGRTATPHVYTGVCAIYHDEDAKITPNQLPGLVIAVTVTVIKRLGGRLAARPYETAAMKLQEYGDVLDKAGSVNPARDDYLGQVKDLVSTLMDKNEKSWRAMEWYHNIQPPNDDSEAEGDDAEATALAEADEDDLIAVTASKLIPKMTKKRKAGEYGDDARLKPGLGTMFCNAVDWLSDDRRAAYEVWRCDTTARIEGIA